ncbi:FUN34 transmembrane protein [Crassisporium funariophilum]|nr:FUN34 transmembrane protein [Crassisporium funariophilum]
MNTTAGYNNGPGYNTGVGAGNGGYNQGLRPSRVANPGPLGLLAFAATTFMFSLYILQTRGITHPNVIVAMALFAGGLAQLLAGMWDFPRGNIFGATTFTLYGAFWLSYATLLLPGSGIVTAYPSSRELSNALGIYFITWFMVTVFLLIGALRRNWGFIVFLTFWAITFVLLAAGEFTARSGVLKAGGALGIVTSLCAFYVGLAELLTSQDTAIFRLPLGGFNNNNTKRI